MQSTEGKVGYPRSSFPFFSSFSHISPHVGTPGDGPDSSDRIKRDSEHEFVEPNNPSSPVPHQTGSWSQAPRRHLAPNSDRDRDNRNIHSSSSSSWRDRDRNERDRDPREWREDERGRELTAGGDSGGVGDRKRSLGYHDGREREDRGSHDRDHRECKLANSVLSFWISTPFPPSFSSFAPSVFSIFSLY